MRRITGTTLIAIATMTFAIQVPIEHSVAASGDNAVVHWNEIALDQIASSGKIGTPSAASLYAAMTQAAVYDAVMAFEGTHEPYAFDGQAPAGASLDAAVATAAHDVLAYYFDRYAQLPQLNNVDTAYAQALAGIPDGRSEDDGIALGAQSADTIIALRANDGRETSVASPANGTEPGQWRRTDGTTDSPAVTPYVAQVTPFLAESPDQFRPKGPRAIDSRKYYLEFERTRLYGAEEGKSLRSTDQTDIAKFWTENTLRQYNRALRRFANDRSLSVADSARLFAMTDIPAADAMIGCWDAKYHYLAWRPLTAIRDADTDGNRWTVADPTWKPLSVTGLHPEYVSGHACLTGAITEGLREFLGSKKIDLVITSTALPGAEHNFARIDELRTEVEDARVFGGDHWTTGGADGTALGDKLAKWALKRYFEEV